MAHIHVVFPSRGRKAIVHNECKPVLQNEVVHWHFHPQNKKVKKVRISFSSPQAKFFPQADGTLKNSVEKEITDGGSIWGKAPKYLKLQKRDKYTIEGLDSKGRFVAGLDPQIITDKPHP